MHHRALLIVSVLALATAIPCRAAEDTRAESASAKMSPPSEQYQSLVQEYETARKDFSKVIGAAKTEEERTKAFDRYPRPEAYVDRFLTLAEQHPKDPTAFEALAWIAVNAGDAPEAVKAFASLARNHITSDKLGRVCQSLIYSSYEGAETMLTTIWEKNPHRAVQGQAAFSLGQYIKERKKGAATEAEKIFEKVIAQFGDLPHYRGTMAQAAQGELFELRNLNIGQAAPEIEGEDVDGKKFKLSDYRGQVVVLDFWGDW